MGEIADMMLEGLLDEETGEYIGDLNEVRYGTASPGFPVSYERDMREFGITRGKPSKARVTCPQCGKRVKEIGLRDHVKDVHGE